jgi:hypothetical protein
MLADDFKAPYGLAYRDGFVLVADQEGIRAKSMLAAFGLQLCL